MLNRLVSAANIAVFTVLVFIALEMTFRVYLFGTAGLNPVKVNSFVNILYSGLLQRADNIEVWYELKPDQETLFRGAPFRTNAHGLADDEYSYEKPASTYRVAVIGSSWTMGAAIAVEDAFHSVLEQEFNQESDSIVYEFMNFGVENYGLGEMMGTINHKALRYDPDMILFVITGFTPTIRWERHDESFTEPPRKNPGWISYVGLRLTGLLGLDNERPGDNDDIRDVIRKEEYGLYSRQLQRAFDELAVIGSENRIPVAIVWLRLNEQGSDDSNRANVFLRRAEKANMAGAVIDLEKYLKPGEPVSKLLVNRTERHPNEYGHRIIAAELRKEIFPDGAPPIPAL